MTDNISTDDLSLLLAKATHPDEDWVFNASELAVIGGDNEVPNPVAAISSHDHELALARGELISLLPEIVKELLEHRRASAPAPVKTGPGTSPRRAAITSRAGSRTRA